MKEHLATGAKIHNKEQLGFRLKRPIELDYERVVESFHDLSFVDYGFDLLFSGQLILSHDLHGIETTSVLLSD